jgi:hypothetical protein
MPLAFGVLCEAQVAVEVVRLVPPDAAALDIFGAEIALGPDVLAVGAPQDGSAGPGCGSIYLYRRVAGTWTLDTEINDPTLDGVGRALAMEGSLIASGNPYVTVAGAQDAGRVDVFEESGGQWILQNQLTAPSPLEDDRFGFRIALSGNTLAVGAPAYFSNPSREGAVFVFVWNGTAWVLEQRLTASDADPGDEFGFSVDVEGDALVVGATDAWFGGAAYVFQRSGGVWSEQTKILNPNPPTSFGRGVRLEGSTLAVGDIEEDTNGYRSGAVYVFRGGGATWNLEARLLAGDGDRDDSLGIDVALSGDRVIGGAPYHDHFVARSGSAYGFVRVGTSWSQQAEILSSRPQVDAFYGGAVDVLGDTAVVGAPSEDGAFNASGAVYVYRLSPIGCALGISPPSLPSGLRGLPYSQTITTTGGVPPYTTSVSRGSLPPGITLSAAGILSGTPITAGYFGFTVLSQDGGGCANEQAYVLRVDCVAPLLVGPPTLPDGGLHGFYSQTITATGGAWPYTFDVTAGSLPTGLSLSPAGTLSGVPIGTGAFSFTVRATDAAQCEGSRAYTMAITCTPSACQGAWTLVSTTGPSGRTQAAMAYDSGRSRVVLYGGFDGAFLEDTWEYDGTSWTSVPVAGPHPLAHHAMAYDARRGVIVVQGGGDSSVVYDETWEYDGAQWQLRSLTPNPGERWAHAMAYSEALQAIVLHGGEEPVCLEGDCASVDTLDDTWVYDGTRWALGTPSEYASDHAMVYDSVRDRIVRHDRDETWEYDGAIWMPGAPFDPAMLQRDAHAMAFAEDRRRTILFGGSGAGVQTWEYDGAAWARGGEPPPALTARYGHAMAYDAARDRVVMFGGYGGGYFGETWEYGCTVAIGPPALPSGAVGSPYQQDVQATGGSPPYTYTVTWGMLPPGLSLSPSGTLSGVPTVSGTFDVEVMARDATRGCTRLYALSVAEAAIDYVTGPGPGALNANRIRVNRADGQGTSVDITAYGAGQFGTNVSAGRVDAAILDTILSGPGPGPALGPQVRAFRADGTPVAKVNYFAYGTLKFGVKATGQKLDLDAFDEIVSTPGPGAAFGPHVRGWDYDGAAIAARSGVNFFAYSTLNYGANGAGTNVQGSSYWEILTGPGPGVVFAPQVRGFRYDPGPLAPLATVNFFAFAAKQYGALVAGGDIDLDAFGEIVAAPGPGPTASFPALFLGFDVDGGTARPIPVFRARPFATVYGATPGLGDVGYGPPLDLLAGAGPDPAADSTVKAYRYATTWMIQLSGQFTPFPGAMYGARVSGAALGY